MTNPIYTNQLLANGLPYDQVDVITDKLNHILETLPAEAAWNKISHEILLPSHPFQLHLFLFSHIYPDWPAYMDSAPAWIPDSMSIQTTNIAKFMSELDIHDLKTFHSWSINHYEDFWERIITKLQIHFYTKPQKICDLSKGSESPQWLAGAKLNIVNSCFNANPKKNALIFKNKQNHLETMTYVELLRLTNRIANSLVKQGFKPQDKIAIYMPMTVESVAIYLGIIKMGGVVVSIADSFSHEEIITRLRITEAKAIFTQDHIIRLGKKIPLYAKVISANAPTAIVVAAEEVISIALRSGDLNWDAFLVTNDHFEAVSCSPNTHINILFSSGTTGDPKAIPWNHTTAIKCASDGYFHQDIQTDDIVAWPTNLGWMMGPWVIFATLLNQATLAVYHDVPRDKAFGEFVQDAKVTILGVVPALVSAWRQTHCMEGLDWSSIKTFTSTGECSNPEDMLYLMSLAGYKPIIEYCGGTEIGGAYISSTLIEKNYPSIFTTPTIGSHFVIIDETGNLTNNGEIALIPTSMGLSTELINFDHHKIYYADMPKLAGTILRRHGDQAYRFTNGTYCLLGRVDDTMNLGGIKTSSAEIERVLTGIDSIHETAAIAVTPAHHGPSHLVIYATAKNNPSKENIKKTMQSRINQHLNPLFKIHDIVFIDEIPKTASNKIMRRILRQQYQKIT